MYIAIVLHDAMVTSVICISSNTILSSFLVYIQSWLMFFCHAQQPHQWVYIYTNTSTVSNDIMFISGSNNM